MVAWVREQFLFSGSHQHSHPKSNVGAGCKKKKTRRNWVSEGVSRFYTELLSNDHTSMLHSVNLWSSYEAQSNSTSLYVCESLVSRRSAASHLTSNLLHFFFVCGSFDTSNSRPVAEEFRHGFARAPVSCSRNGFETHRNFCERWRLQDQPLELSPPRSQR